MENKTDSKGGKKTMTEKQKAARLANLARGRKKRMESINKKKNEDKEDMETEKYEVELSDNKNDSETESEDDFVLSRSKKTTKKKQSKDTKESKEDKNLRHEFDELRNIVKDLAILQKKQHKAVKKTQSSSGGTKIAVVMPPEKNSTKSTNDTLTDALRRSLM